MSKSKIFNNKLNVIALTSLITGGVFSGQILAVEATNGQQQIQINGTLTPNIACSVASLATTWDISGDLPVPQNGVSTVPYLLPAGISPDFSVNITCTSFTGKTVTITDANINRPTYLNSTNDNDVLTLVKANGAEPNLAYAGYRLVYRGGTFDTFAQTGIVAGNGDAAYIGNGFGTGASLGLHSGSSIPLNSWLNVWHAKQVATEVHYGIGYGRATSNEIYNFSLYEGAFQFDNTLLTSMSADPIELSGGINVNVQYF